jgi:hypothetical protein
VPDESSNHKNLEAKEESSSSQCLREEELPPVEKTAVAACRCRLSGNEAARQSARVYLKVKLLSLDRVPPPLDGEG